MALLMPGLEFVHARTMREGLRAECLMCWRFHTAQRTPRPRCYRADQVPFSTTVETVSVLEQGLCK